MTKLPLYQEFQAIHDNLRVIDRDLSNFPPDLAKIHADRKQAAEQMAALQKELGSLEPQRDQLAKAHALAQRQEATARAAVKATTSKGQYSAALRELGSLEHQTAMALKPLKEAESRLAALQERRSGLETRLAELDEAFSGLHEAFLGEHENQVSARKTLLERRDALEGELGPTETAKLHRLLEARHGRAVVPVENGTCSGCRTKLRSPFLARFREEPILPCEACQRLVFVPARHA